MAKRQGKSRLWKVLRGLGSLILALLVTAGIYLTVLLLEQPEGKREDTWIVREEPQPITRMQAVQTGSVQELSALFGATLPALPGYTVSGEGRNVTHDGALVRQATLTYPGLTITAVRPAAAAPLLLRPELTVSLRNDVTVMNLPAVLAKKGGAWCVYFSDENAAYAVYAPAAKQEDFLALLARLTPIQ